MSDVEVDAVVVGIRRGRPPMQTVSVDVTIRPPSGDSWLLVADVIGDDPVGEPSGIHTVDRFDVAPGRSIVWLKGHVGVVAVPLVGDDLVVISALPLRRWEELREDSAIEVSVADSLSLDGVALEDVFDERVSRWPASRVAVDGEMAAEKIRQRLEAPFEAPFSVQINGSRSSRVPLRF